MSANETSNFLYHRMNMQSPDFNRPVTRPQAPRFQQPNVNANQQNFQNNHSYPNKSSNIMNTNNDYARQPFQPNPPHQQFNAKNNNQQYFGPQGGSMFTYNTVLHQSESGMFGGNNGINEPNQAWGSPNNQVTFGGAGDGGLQQLAKVCSFYIHIGF